MSKLMQKDLNLALQTAQDTGVETPMGAKATELYESHVVKSMAIEISLVSWVVMIVENYKAT